MKILIISNNSISQTANNGKTVNSFLKGLSPGNIANLYFGTNEIPDLSACANYYRITEIDIFRSIISLRFKTTNTHSHLLNSDAFRNNEKQRETGLLQYIKSHSEFFSPLREFMWKLNTWDTKDLNSWIKDFAPDVIFAVLGGCIFTHTIAQTLSQRYNIPLYSYFTDDYILSKGISWNFKKHLQLVSLRNTYFSTIKKSKKTFVIGEKMKKAYEAYFKREFGILVNGIRPEMFSDFSPKQYSLSETFKLAYIGGLHLNRWESLVKIARIIKEYCNINIDFRVYCTSIPDNKILNQFNAVGIKYDGGLSFDGVIRKMREIHCLIHVESFNEKERKYTKYSISTKIPEYMASRRGIIVYGPSEIASVEIFSKNNIGLVLSETDDSITIANRIMQYVETYNQIDFEKQYSFAVANFDQNKMKLVNILN